ncbi:hypothetical protein AXF42_Ash011846 [Apostasia shenzhenica]|uniref:Uncharacterized protein n=1 Tax=Apostasia shenzhenica TaxID=1088818 RepID=A0A2I0AW03_9ASPA|nr:hypothetical protein AXF42_Ash011846 [Apostasia shenzhenica]
MRLKMLRGCLLPEERHQKSSPPANSLASRVIRLDGEVTLYRRRVMVAELMRDNESHLVCRPDSFIIGQKVPALSASDELELGHSYFLLPTQFFDSALSFVTVASLLAGVGGGGSLRHFDIQVTGAGKLQIRICENLAERRAGLVCTTAELEREYEQLVGSRSRPWRPKLETIRQSSERRMEDEGIRRFCGFSRKKAPDQLKI